MDMELTPEIQSSQPMRVSFDWPSLGQLVISALGALLFFSIGTGMLLAGMLGGFGQLSGQETQITSSMGWSSLLLGALNIPSAVYAIARLSGKEILARKRRSNLYQASIAMCLIPGVLLAGNALSGAASAGVFLTPLQLLVVGIPLWWLYEVGRRGLGGFSAQRAWGLLSFGLVVTQIVTIVVEIIMVGGVVLGGATLVAVQPGGAEMFMDLAQRLQNSAMDEDALLRILEPIIQNPLVILAGIGLASGLIPLLEELLKPLGLWVVSYKKLTPAQGFQAGILSGLAFALAESLGSLAQSLGGDWAAVAVGRMGTGGLHMVTCGLVGWGLASAWSERHYLRLALAFLLAVSLHGIWNVFGLLLGLADLLDPVLAGNAFLVRLGSVAPFAMGVLLVTMVFILLGANRRLRQPAVAAEV